MKNFGLYTLDEQGVPCVAEPSLIVSTALSCLNDQVQRGCTLDSPSTVKAFLSLKLGALEHEVFAVLFLDSKLALIEYKEMFRGTLAQAAVYPREIVKEALALNAQSIILAHNHPSGVTTPSRSDEHLTQTIQKAAAVLDIRVADHIVVGGGAAASFAELGLL